VVKEKVKDGYVYKINGLNVVDDEFYTSAFPASLMQERVALPFMRDNTPYLKPQGVKLHEAVINYLTGLKEANQKAALQLFENYKEDYDLRKVNAQPPQDETTAELDQKLEDFGPVAVEDYFWARLQNSYLQNFAELMENRPKPQGLWRFNLKNLSLQITNTDVRNEDKYINFTNTRLNSDSQTLIQGNLNMALEYYKDKIRWDNTLFAEYGRVSIRPYDKERYINESVDKILLSTEYTYKSIDVKNFAGGFLAGPFLNLSYQTEFTAPDDKPRYKAVRGKGGMRLFEGKYLKDFYLAIVPELDFTYPQTATNYAWEFGFKAEQPINDKSKIIYTAMIRDYFISKNSNPQNDYSYELELDARIQTEIWRKFSIAPFINYYQAKANNLSATGSNLYIGVAISYSRLFKNLPF
jgi:hypothetical protein